MSVEYAKDGYYLIEPPIKRANVKYTDSYLLHYHKGYAYYFGENQYGKYVLDNTDDFSPWSVSYQLGKQEFYKNTVQDIEKALCVMLGHANYKIKYLAPLDDNSILDQIRLALV